MDPKLVTPVADEFAAVELGDRRLRRRLSLMAEAAERRPGATLPERAGSIAALEGTYRFFANPNVNAEALLNSHVAETLNRAAAESEVLVIHDTTEFRFGGTAPREGMGWLNSDHVQGFLAHFSIAVSRQGRPLGTVGLQAWTRRGPRVGPTKKKRMANLRNPDRESQRWLDASLLAADRLHNKAAFVHVMDREGDQFELLSFLVEHDQRFVVRLGHDRRLEPGRGTSANPKLFESLTSCPLFFSREVAIGTRGKPAGSKKAQHPPRKSRSARLEVRAGQKRIFASHMVAAHLPASLTLQVVEVREVDPPEGEQPVIWRLVTTEPVDSEAQVAAVVDAYRQRWLIEEFFKAIKTGCRYQLLQLESLRALLIALAIETAVAWRLLLLRWVAHNCPNADAETVLSRRHVLLLTALRVSENGPPPAALNARDALFDLARLGGQHPKQRPAGVACPAARLRRARVD